MRLLCATGEKHTYAETQISLSCEGYEFKTKGKTVVQNGWKAVEELFKASLKTKEKDDPAKSLPEVHEGDMLEGVSASVTEHFTTPPKQYTDDHRDPRFVCVPRGLGLYSLCAFQTIGSLYLLYSFSWTITAAAEIFYFLRSCHALSVAHATKA